MTAKNETAMAAAFARAKIAPEPPGVRLLMVGVDAWARFPGANGDTARRNYVADQLRVEMAYALFDDYDKTALGAAIGWLLLKAEKAIVEQRPSVTPANPPSDRAGSQATRGNEPTNAPSIPTTRASARSNLTVLADKQAARATASAATAIRLSRLDTFVINGQKIGDLTSAEANAWAGSRERDARFVRLLTANLPPDRPIREFRKGDEADEFYARAENENAT